MASVHDVSRDISRTARSARSTAWAAGRGAIAGGVGVSTAAGGDVGSGIVHGLRLGDLGERGDLGYRGFVLHAIKKRRRRFRVARPGEFVVALSLGSVSNRACVL